MQLWRKHWFDLGAVLALPLSLWLYWHCAGLPPIQLILGVSLVTLLLHQVEEYRWPGYFPGMLNAAVYGSAAPDRYPLNTQTSLVINVPLGWVTYALAALLAQHAPWLGVATVIISLGNVLAHTVFFNLKGRTWYNPGQATALLLFLPLAGWFIYTVRTQHLASSAQWVGPRGGTKLRLHYQAHRLASRRAHPVPVRAAAATGGRQEIRGELIYFASRSDSKSD